MDKESFERILKENPDRKFCLHDGFAGFSYGSPSNPKWITNEKAFKILSRYERLTGIDPIENFKEVWKLDTLLFENKAWILRWTTRHRMIGFNREQDALFGNAGLG
jgi:hypothetical protein